MHQLSFIKSGSWAAVFIILAACSSSVCAQGMMPEQTIPVIGRGVASVSVPPQQLRVLIALEAEGKSLESAAEAMKESVEAAKLELTALGAIKDSFNTDAIKVDNELGDKYARLRSQMMSYGGGSFGGSSRGGPPKPDTSDIVRVKQFLVADWELTKTGFALLAETVLLEKKLKAISFGGDSSASDLSPEEAEMLEEAGMFSDDEEDESGPKLFYISSITVKEKNKLQEEALQAAKANAEVLAGLVKRTVGDVVMIKSSDAEDSALNLLGRMSYGYGRGYGGGDSPPQDLITPKSRQKVFKVSPASTAQKFVIGLQVGYKFAEN